MVRVAAVQFATGPEVDANLATLLRMVDEAVGQGAELVVLPEFCNHPSWYTDDAQAWDVACDLDGPFVTAVADKARAAGVWVMLNVTVRREPGRLTDTNVLLDATGAIVGTSDKQVLMGGERLHISEGTEDSPVLDTPFGPVGLYSCMDGVIFETPRMLAVRGAHLLLNSLNSFALDEASLHVPVRAAENKVWVVAANKVGYLIPDGTREHVASQLGIDQDWLQGAGESQIVAPDGTVVAIAPRHGEAVIVADIDVSLAADKCRPDGTDVMAARRGEAYAPVAQEPRAVPRQPGPIEVLAAVLTDPADLGKALSEGARLVVLPELAQTAEGTTDDPGALADAAEDFLDTLRCDAVVVTSIVRRVGDEYAHVAVAVSPVGTHEQVALHASARHPWATVLANEVAVVSTEVGRVALLVGDDLLYPEAVRLAAIAGAEVVAAPYSALEAWEVRTGLVERAAENRINLVAASRVTEAGHGMVIAAQQDFTLWTPWERDFDGTINFPVVNAAPRDGSMLVAAVHPAATANRFVSRGTDVVDGRPWALASVLTER